MTAWSGRRVVVTGGRGFLGRRVVSFLGSRGANSVGTFGSADYDLTRQGEVARMDRELRPEVVIHLAARVGGIGANRANAGRYFYDNAIMGIEMLEQGRRAGIQKFVQVGTICSYPKFAPIPFREEDLWEGFPEETNAPYGVAKKALLVMAQGYREQYGLNAIFVMPANLYGPGDNFDPASSHVIPALIRKCVEAAETAAPSITVWGTGSATREFLHVDDAAMGIVLAAERYDRPEPVNLGTTSEISIRDLVALIMELTGYRGEVEWDASRPDGQPRRMVSTERARREFGFAPEKALRDGLRETIDWYRSHRPAGSGRAL